MSDETASTTLSPSALRIHSLMRELVVILSENPEGVQIRELLKFLKERMPPNDAEQGLNSSGVMRYDTNVRFWSVGLSKAEFVTKEKGVWRITEQGRQALAEFPDTTTFGLEVNRRYREWDEARSLDQAGRENWAGLDQILAAIPKGFWVSAGDLGKVSGSSAGMVGIHIWRDRPQGWYKVLRRSGQPAADVYDVQERLSEQRDLLAAEGITIDPRAPRELRIELADLEAIASEVRGAPGAWLMRGTSVRGSSIAPTWLAEGFVSLPASQLPAIEHSIDEDGLRAAVDKGYDGLNYSQRKAKYAEIRTFMKRVAPGHLVLTVSGDDIYLGEITGEAHQVESPGRRSNLRRSVEWTNKDEPIDQSDVSARLLDRLRTQSDIVDVSDFFDEIVTLLGPDLEDVEGEVEDAPAVNSSAQLSELPVAVLERLLVAPDWTRELVQLLQDRRQVILYGPPGTGKTYLAQEVAEELAGKDHVTLVQFHPSYAYEDFFEGYRPTSGTDGSVELQLVSGPFRKVVDLARANPNEPYFLIVDEINRANLAKVFGELYFLLEYRDRTIDLLYSSGDSGPGFSLPANVYIIGTMNTADRSIALVDSAMRRRFAFLSLHPEDERLDLVLRAWLRDRNLPEDRADLLVELNRRIQDKDFKIGPSYFMNANVRSDEGLDRIWRTSIIPLLEEYHVGDGIDIRSKYGLDSLRATLASQGTTE
jgi:5-methylcytosine-specific restriction protein B